MAFRARPRIARAAVGAGAALAWGTPPSTTRSFAIVCDDPDAPGGSFVHWLVWNLPVDRRSLPAGIRVQDDAFDLRQGRNDFGVTGYRGPAPPPGDEHHYVFRVLALDALPDLPTGSTRAAIERAIEGHVVAEGALRVSYRR